MFSEYFSDIWFYIVVYAACIVISCISACKSSKFISDEGQRNYNGIKGFFVASLVLFIVTCVLFLSELLTVIIAVATVLVGEAELFDLLFFVRPAASIVAIIFGIRALVKYSRAKNLYFSLYPPVFPYPQSYRPYNGYPAQGGTVQPPNFYTAAPVPPPVFPAQPSVGKIETVQGACASFEAHEDEKRCPSCGTLNKRKYKFCIFCGASFDN